MLEPGLDRHEWESRWASLEEELEDSPRDVLPELDELVEQMLEERGYAIDDAVVREGYDRAVVAEFLSARGSRSFSRPTRIPSRPATSRRR